MSFKTLAERFEQRSRSIYNKFPASATQLVVIKPDTAKGAFGSKSRIKDDSRTLPIVSFIRDATRVSEFLKSPEGKQFLAKQLLLQAGNTFVTTRLYNPLSLFTKVPFNPLSLFTKVPAALARHAKIPFLTLQTGLLQHTTTGIMGNRFGESDRTTPGLGARATTLLRRIGANFNIVSPTFNTSRPEYKVFGVEFFDNAGIYTNGERAGPRLFANQPLNQRGSRKEFVTFKPNTNTNTEEDGKSFVEAAKAFRTKFDSKPIDRTSSVPVTRFNSPYFTESAPGGKTDVDDGTADNFYTSNVTRGKLQTGLRDVLNLSSSFTYRVTNDLTGNPPRGLDAAATRGPDGSSNWPIGSDIITFVFKSGLKDLNTVQFRALISSIKESVKPEFNEQRYVGRTERFVTYGGVKRNVSLAFNVVAFSPGEMDGMWSKINYLTGLTFPASLTTGQTGFMTPPLFKITIGKIYEDQPCYIESLDYEFLDDATTFDINKQVPFAVNVTMQLSLLEKRSRFYNSPFYAITEDIVTPQSRPPIQEQPPGDEGV